MSPEWLTNDVEAARRLRAIEADYARARAAAKSLPLAQKIDVYREARRQRGAAIAAAMRESTQVRFYAALMNESAP